MPLLPGDGVCLPQVDINLDTSDRGVLPVLLGGVHSPCGGWREGLAGGGLKPWHQLFASGLNGEPLEVVALRAGVGLVSEPIIASKVSPHVVLWLVCSNCMLEYAELILQHCCC